MGESFLGLPNRFKIVNNLLDKTFDPNHALSAYQGYVISKNYVNRTGGEDYCMEGTLVSRSIAPLEDSTYGRYGTLTGYDLGSYDKKYRYIHAHYLYGTAEEASKWSHKMRIEITGDASGSVEFDGSTDVSLKLTVAPADYRGSFVSKSGDSVTGNIRFNGYGIGINNKENKQLFAEDPSSIIRIGRGPYTSGYGGIVMYSKGYLTMHTKQDGIRIQIESGSTGYTNPYVSIGADWSGVFMSYSGHEATLKMNRYGELLYNGNTVWHSGNLTPRNYAQASHTHNYAGSSSPGGPATTALECTGNSATAVVAFTCTGNASTATALTTSAGGLNTPIYFSDGKPKSCSGYLDVSVKSANQLTEKRYIKIGNTLKGMTFAKNEYVEWTLDDIGAANILHDHNYAGSSTPGGSADSALTCTGNSATATRLLNDRIITIGNSQKVFNGTSNVSWSLSEIGAASSSHTHSYLPLSGGTMTGSVYFKNDKCIKVNHIYATEDQRFIKLSRTGGTPEDMVNVVDAAIDDLACDRIVPSFIVLQGSSTASQRGNIVIGVKDKCALYVKYAWTTTSNSYNTGKAGYELGILAPVYAKSFNTSSDIKLKKNIEAISLNESVKIVSELTPVKYSFKTSEDKTDRGLIAQQVKEVMDWHGLKDQVYSYDDSGDMVLDYIQLIPDIINTLKYILQKIGDDSIVESIESSLEFDETQYRKK